VPPVFQTAERAGERRERLRVRQRFRVNLEERRVKLGLTEAGAIEIDDVGGIIAGADEQNRKRRRRRVLQPKFVRHGDGSEHNYMRSLCGRRDACNCGLQVKIRRDDSHNYHRNYQHADEFEPALHGNPTRTIIVQSPPSLSPMQESGYSVAKLFEAQIVE